ncbi:hypothetical protein FPOAC2_01754 [Fusarium poae]|uniref:hypothetical protein n=1 Tax=Fusarium poae TaxID=36050 RepID=UPI001CE85208|nr:hypothetical protein FPOAC1_001670 [Fusarium poae]KAG8675684.1 hypothetical protein FPOAC1_001670 [Fusarium poae]
MSESTSKSIDAGAAVANALDSRDPVVATAPADSNPNNTATAKTDPAFLHSPPDSNNTAKSDGSDSELSDLEDEPILSDPPQPVDPSDKNTSDEDKDKPSHEDIGEVLPDDWSGAVPIFKPTMHQFRDFKRFMEAVNSYGMKSGIIKVIPPQEWIDSLPKLDDLVKQVKVREPIKQDIMGSNGTYRQVNIVHGRSYNLPQWRQLCDQSEHQPPARRGERRANAEKPKPRTRTTAPAPKPVDPSVPKKRGRGRPAKRGGRGRRANPEPAEDAEDRPMTPISPKPDATEMDDKPVESVEQDPGEEVEDDYEPKVGRMGVSRPARTKTQTVSARRKYSRREGSAMIDEAAFKDWDYKMETSEYTPERCEELERAYWKTLTYAPPLYGADLMGTLFDESTEEWNLNKLPNLLDVLGTKVPGVNTAYLYLGMWKATFAWHLEDVDLYSINYLHFGAPKQWYSISQADARRFEAAMKNIWPTDAKACDQFLRHKGFLISPQHLKSHYNITVNKVVSYPGEFVVTYPYGYHSGYNLGYNCAEAVNFALDSWLEIGKIAKKCECAQAQDSVWVNVYEIERKLRGEETEYEETEEEEEDDEEDDDDEQSGMPTPPSISGVKIKEPRRKRKRGPGDKSGKVKVKKIRLRLKAKAEPPCCLCPNDTPSADLLPTDDGRKAHRLCAHYLPETYIETIDNQETVVNVSEIQKDRLDLKCLYCRSKRGACFQCSQKKCARAYHATCAAAAGVFVEEEEVPVFGEDGTEYKEQAFEFSCRFHRTKRDKKLDGELLDMDTRIQTSASKIQPGETCQFQYHKGDIFAGVVIENRADEQTLLVDILPNGDRLEVQWKWLLVPDPADYRLPKASANAIPMPASQKAKDKLKTRRLHDGKPQKDDPFVEGCTWAEFQLHPVSNKEQVNIDFSKPDQIWHYLPKTSTDARAQFTEDPAKQRHNPQGNFLSTVPKPVKPVRPPRAVPPYAQQRPYQPGTPYNTGRLERPYVYKPRIPAESNLPTMGSFTTQRFAPTAPLPVPIQHHHTQYPSYAQPVPPGHQSPHPAYSAQRFEVRSSPAPIPPGSTPTMHNPLNAPVHSQHTQWPRVTNASHPSPVPAAAAGVTYFHKGVHQSPYQAPAHHQQAHPVQQQNHHMKASWQVHQSIYQRYPFFQVNYNRDSNKYRTPYATQGGFTNGYEGNMRAHIMANPDAFLRGQPSNYNHGAHSSPYQRPSAVPPPAPSPSQMPPSGHEFRQQSFPKGVPAPSPMPTHPTSGQFPRPALKAQYLPPIQSQTQAQGHPQQCQQPQPNPQQMRNPQDTTQTPNQNSKLKTATVFKPYKIPPKESPVPLPANFLAAMTSTPNTMAAAGQLALQQPSNKGSPVEPKPVRKVQATQQSPSGASTPGKQPLGAKISETPVPIPRLPGFVPVSTSREQAASPQTHVLNHNQSSRLLPSHQGSPVTPVATKEQMTPSVRDGKLALTNVNPGNAPQTVLAEQANLFQPHDFPDVPGSGSMKFMDSLLENIRTIARRDEKP